MITKESDLISKNIYNHFKNHSVTVILLFISLFVGNLVYLSSSDNFPITIYKVSVALVIFSFIYQLIRKNYLVIKVTGIEIEILLLLSLICLSLSWTPVPLDGFFQFVRFITSLFVCFSAFNLVKSWNTIEKIFWSVSVVSIIITILSVKDILSNPYAAVQSFVSAGQKIGDRATVVDQDPNIVSTLFFLPIFFGASLFSNKYATKKIQLIGAFLVAINSIGLFTTLSRSGILSISIGLLIIIITLRNTKIILAGIGGLAAMILVKPELIFSLISLSRRFIGLLTGQVDASASIRFDLLKGSWEMFVDSKLLGVGFRGFGDTYLNTNYVSAATPVYEPHNMIYTVYAELGLIGLLLVSWITVRVFRTALANLKSSDKNEPITYAIHLAIFCSLIAYFIFFQFLGGAFNNNLFLLICTLPFMIQLIQDDKSLDNIVKPIN